MCAWLDKVSLWHPAVKQSLGEFIVRFLQTWRNLMKWKLCKKLSALQVDLISAFVVIHLVCNMMYCAPKRFIYKTFPCRMLIFSNINWWKHIKRMTSYWNQLNVVFNQDTHKLHVNRHTLRSKAKWRVTMPKWVRIWVYLPLDIFYLSSDVCGMDLLKSFMLSNGLIEASTESLII